MKTGTENFLEAANRVVQRWHGIVYAISAFILGIVIAWHVLNLATPLSTPEILLLIVCLAGLAAGLWVRGGEMRLQSAISTLAIYAGGFAASLAVYNTIADPNAPLPEWQLWLMFTAVFVLVYRWCLYWFKPSRRLEAMTDAERAEYLAVKAAGARRKAELRSLPSNSWYELASFVTGAAMVGSFATTAIGFHHEIVDPLDPPLVQYGVPIGLSALAALIIWAGWNFVFLRIRIASNTVSRLFGFIVGFIVLVPLTLAIHTVFGIIGVGGTEGLRAHNLWYTDVLDAYERRVDGIRAIEASRLDGALSYMSNQLKAAAANEETTGQGCGAGRGSLFTFYTDSAARTATILNVVTNRKNANQDIKSEIEQLRARIRKPEGQLEDIQPDLAAQADRIRKKIVDTDNSSTLPSVKTFVTETRATVNSEAFFSGWSACTLTKKDVILSQLNTLVDSVEEAANSATRDIDARKSSPEFRIPVENRIETIPFIDRYFHGERQAADAALQEAQADANSVPVFVPLRPFWAVVSYAGSLMGYIALQLALDFSPAVLGLLFALLAPFPDRRTRLGRVYDNFMDKRFPRKAEPERPDPFVAPVRRDAEPVVAKATPVIEESDVAVAEPVRSADTDDDSRVEPDERSEPMVDTTSAERIEPKFEDENAEEDDHIRDGKPGDVRPY
ncbi:hypothetical protein IHQ71_02580 [Rhizobium sp. TH2]|uniref:YccS/YhfK family membrane protein n=1 Tax=Rhizobium sp. TH2 TaxID=2775403 RepID=UPI0021578EBA|nr:YccS/YhfK family membrane protein [Rhizobium sp. TH2]UVC09531.1 hypothetical protein IHQ71_02580 [Rhizobium sp. TH2]